MNFVYKHFLPRSEMPIEPFNTLTKEFLNNKQKQVMKAKKVKREKKTMLLLL